MNFSALWYFIPIVLVSVALVIGAIVLWRKKIRPRLVEWFQGTEIWSWWQEHNDDSWAKIAKAIISWLAKRTKLILWLIGILAVYLVLKAVSFQRLIQIYHQLSFWPKAILTILGALLVLVVLVKIKGLFDLFRSVIWKKEETLKSGSVWFRGKSFVKWVIIPLIPTLYIIHRYYGQVLPPEGIIQDLEFAEVVFFFLRRYFFLFFFWTIAWAILVRMNKERGDYKYYILFPCWLAGVWLILSFTPLIPKSESAGLPKREGVFQLLKPDSTLMAAYHSVKEKPDFVLLPESPKNPPAHKDDFTDLPFRSQRGGVIIVYAKGKIQYGNPYGDDEFMKSVREGRVFATPESRKKLRDPEAHPLSPVIMYKSRKSGLSSAWAGGLGSPEDENGALFFLQVVSRDEGNLYLMPHNMPRDRMYYGKLDYGFTSDLTVYIYYLSSEELAGLASN